MALKRLGLVVGILLLLGIILAPVLDPVSSLEDPPPGADADGVTNASVLVDAHREILEDDEHLLRVRIGDGSEATELVYRSDNNEQQAELHITGDGTQPVDVYMNQTAWYKRETRVYTRLTDGEPFEQYNSNPLYKFGGPEFNTVADLEGLISDYTYTAVNTTTVHNETYVRYKITGSEIRDDEENVNGHLVIREDGFIREFAVESDYSNIYFRYNINEEIDVDRPQWTSEADRAISESGGGGFGGGNGCNNDGDQSYNEDNDRDNDGICDED